MGRMADPWWWKGVWIVAVTAGLAALAAPVQAESDPKRPLLWGADSEGGAPYISKDPKSDQYVGFEVELIDALAKELGQPIKYVQYDFKELIPGLQRGDFDFAMNGVEMTPDRIKAVRFIRPYYVYTLQLAARVEDNRFQSLEDCKRLGLVIGTMEDTAAERLLDQMGIRKKTFGNQVDPYRDLAMSGVDGVLLDFPIALYWGKPNPKLKFVGKPVGEGYYGIAFRKADEELAQRVDKALGRLIDSGELRKIYEKWGLWNEAQERLTQGDIREILRDLGRDWTFAHYFPTLLEGAEVTVFLTCVSMVGAMLLGLPIALVRLYAPQPFRSLAVVYVEFFRGIPVLLLLYFLYYGMPEIADYYRFPWSFRLPPVQAAILGFALNYAAYQAEIFRAGIHSIPIGQWEAAASLGMSRLLTFRRIIMPQAVRVILPPMTNDFVALFKDTSVVSILAVVELTKQYQILAKSSLKFLEIGLLTSLLYLIMSVPLGYLSRYLEKRWGKGV